MLIARLPPLPPLPATTNVAGVDLTFLRAWRVGVLCAVAELPDDHPKAGDVLNKLAMMPRQFQLVREDERGQVVIEGGRPLPAAVVVDARPNVSTSVAPPVASPPVPAWASHEDPILASMLVAAHRNGWERSDLDGTCLGGDPGLGRSNTSALTLAEMALTARPVGWAPGVFPWEVEGWRPPALGWTPPKTGPAPAPSAPAVPAASAAPAPPPSEPAPDAPAPAATSEVEVVEPIVVASVDPVPPQAPTGDVLAGWGTAEQIAQARALLLQLTKEAGKAPSVNKARYHLERHALPKVNAAQLAALIA